MRIVSASNTTYNTKANYYNTEGSKIRSYFNHRIFITPIETIEVVIDGSDIDEGAGCNVLLPWKRKAKTPESLFKVVMNSMKGTQEVSFTIQEKYIQ